MLQRYQKDFLLLQSHKSENTKKNYRLDLDLFSRFLLLDSGVKRLDDLRDEFAIKYVNFLSEKVSADNSRRRKLQTVRLFFDHLVYQEIIPENPFKKIKPAPKMLLKPECHSVDNVKKIFDLLENDLKAAESDYQELLAWRNIVIVLCIMKGATNVSVLEKLDLSAIIYTNDGAIRLMMTHKKRVESYTVPLHSIPLRPFKRYFSLRKKYFKLNSITGTELFFSGNQFQVLSTGLSSRGMELFFKKVSNAIGEIVTAKSLRQTCLFMWLSEGVPSESIKEWMGVAPSYDLNLYLEAIEEILVAQSCNAFFKDLHLLYRFAGKGVR